MSTIQSVFLGFLQGVAEFLPVSSSGHLAVFQSFMKLDPPLLYDILLHCATLLAVVLVFRKAVWKLLKGFFRTLFKKGDNEDKVYFKAAVIILIATALTVAIGFPLEKLELKNSPKIISVLFLFTALVLFLSKKFAGKRKYKDLNWKDGITLGIAQGIAVLPGISRSGMTISASLFRGISRDAAGELSFLLSIPAILGAMILDLKDFTEMSSAISVPALILGMLTAFAVGLVSLLLLLKLVRKGKLHYFGFYLVPFAILLFFLL